MSKITIKEAADMLGVPPQAARTMIRHGCIQGASCYGTSKARKTYYVTAEQITNFMKGGAQNEQGQQ